MSKHSQVDAIGAPPVKTWDDYRRGCKMTYAGGYDGAEFVAFQHGMDTVFNLLEAEFPPAEVCKAPQPESAAKRVEWHDRLGAMIDQVGHPKYSLHELITGMRQLRDEMLTAVLPVDTAPWQAMAYAKLGYVRDKMLPEHVAVVQDFIGPLPTVGEEKQR